MRQGSIDRVLAEQISRRDALKVGGGFALAAGLSACGVGGGSEGADTTRAIEPKVDGDLVYLNYSQYVNPALVEQFEAKHGVTVRESYFDTMPGMMTKLGSGNRYDLCFPTAEFVDKLVKADQLLEIPRDKIPAAEGVFSYYDDPWYDPGSAHSLPYSIYATGLGYRADHVEMTGSWRDIVNPQADGRTWMLDDFQEAIGMANLVNGFDMNTTDPEELEQSKEYLIALKPDLRGLTVDTINTAASGNGWVVHLWNGDVINARYRMDNPDDLQFQKNEEGVPVGSDVFAIPANAEHPGTALLFIDFLLENAARNCTWTGYAMPTENSQKAYEELVKGEPSLQVGVDDLESGEQFANLEGEDRELWDRTWTEVKAT